MTRPPSTLAESDFVLFPTQARALALQHLAVLRQIPLPLLPLLLREIATYDWKFPRERTRLEAQLHWLANLTPDQRTAAFSPFANLKLPSVLDDLDWTHEFGGYLDQLTAALWSSGEMPHFRAAATSYAAALSAAVPEPMPSQPRLGIVVLGSDLRDAAGRGATFGKLRARGVHLTSVYPLHGLEAVLEHVQMRAHQSPESRAHWYLDGGEAVALPPAITTSSYATLEPVRAQLLQRAHNAMSEQRSGPEELRTLMARLRPEELGLPAGTDPVMAHFHLSLLTEGSGTQIFSTTFVQWAARECLRRAEPDTLLAFFRPRQRQQGMNELLGGQPAEGADLAGSLVDAEQGAYYTLLNLLRLQGAEQARFLAWQQGSSEAVVIGPGLPRGSTSASPLTLKGALALVT